MEELDRKYAQVLLKRCLTFNNTDTLLIDYETHEHDKFVNIVIDEAKKMNVKNIQKVLYDDDELHDYYKNTALEDIKLNPLIDRTPWNEAAKKNGCVLHISTYIPNLMDDIQQDKIDKAFSIKSKTYEYYKENNKKYSFPWCICLYPNKRWAEFLFKNDKNAYEKLYNYIIQMCMIDKDNPLESWKQHINTNNYYKNRLNELEVTKFYYKNSLGTDFEIGFPKDYIWLNLDKYDQFGSPIICNMPSYEIFTTPDRNTANGIVYNSKPLIRNGVLIDDFYIEFKDGKVINYNAKVGYEALKSIIGCSLNTNRLGEVALVNHNSPISNTNVVFYHTLFDENSSCHLALGDGFPKSIKNFENMTKEELEKLGVNFANSHVDFMIGTSDLEITADTKEGKKYVFKKGNFSL